MLLVLCAASLGGTGIAHAGGFGVIVPPLRADMGPLAIVDSSGARHGSQIAVGVHWASLYPKETPIDVGVGLVAAFVDEDTATGAKSAAADEDSGLSLAGGYLDLSTRLAGGRIWRTWGGLRGEALRADGDDRGHAGLGIAARISAEIYDGAQGAGAAGSGVGIMFGVAALGAYAEVSYRDLRGPFGGVGLSSGVTVRLPFIIAGG